MKNKPWRYILLPLTIHLVMIRVVKTDFVSLAYTTKVTSDKHNNFVLRKGFIREMRKIGFDMSKPKRGPYANCASFNSPKETP